MAENIKEFFMNNEKWQPVSGPSGNGQNDYDSNRKAEYSMGDTSLEELRKTYQNMRTMRKVIEKNTTHWKTTFMLAGSLVGSMLYLVGLIQGGLSYPEGIHLATLSAIVGLMVFGLFFPLFVCLYFSRGFLDFIKRIEDKVFPNDPVFRGVQEEDEDE